MKTLKNLFALSVIVFAFAGCNSAQQQTKSDDSIKIGAVLTMSGSVAVWGENTKNGIDLAVKEINEKGGLLGKKVAVVYENSKGDSTTAVAAATKLITEDHVQCIIGDVTSALILSICPVMEKNKVVNINFGVAGTISQAGDYIFRNWNSGASDAQFTSAYAIKHSKKIVVLYQTGPFGTSMKNSFIDAVKGKNVQIVFTEVFKGGETDFKDLISKFKDKDFDGIYVACYYQEAMNLLKQLKEMSVKKTTIYATSEWEESSLADYIKDNYPDRVFYGYPTPPDSTLAFRKHFVEAFRTAYSKNPEFLTDNGYDAINMLAYGIQKAGKYDGEKIKDALYTLKDFKGASGVMSFDENGDVHKPFGLRSVTKSGLIWVKTD